MALMKSIAPERCQQELQEVGDRISVLLSAIWPNFVFLFTRIMGMWR